MSDFFTDWNEFFDTAHEGEVVDHTTNWISGRFQKKLEVGEEFVCDFLAKPFSATVGFSNADYICDGVADNIQIQAAIDAVNAAGGGTVYVKPGTYDINVQLTSKSNVSIIGSGEGVTVLMANTGIAFGYVIRNTVTIENFNISNLTIDCNNTSHGSGFQLYYATNCVTQNITFKNGATSGWLMKLGVTNGASDAVLNFNNKIIDCTFDTHTGSLEMLLIFNAQNTEIIRPYFTGKTSGPVFGLWQKCYDTNIESPYFEGNTGGFQIYYSITVERTTINNLKANNCSSVIRGSNVSDNGAFGLTQAQGLIINNPVIIGGANSTGSIGIQLGAVNNAVVNNPIVEGMQIGIVIDDGNTPASSAATNWSIIGGKIRNNNSSNNSFTIHPGILFQSVGGNMFGQIIGTDLYDDQGTQTQRYPIVFTGALTWDYINIVNNRLSADTGSGGTSIRRDSGATLGTNIIITSNQDYSGANPAQNSYFSNGDTELNVNTTDTSQTLNVGGNGNFIKSTDDAFAANIRIVKDRAGAIVQNGDEIGYIQFRGYNGSSYDRAAMIIAHIDATPGASNDMPGRLEFYTTPNGSSSALERMTIKNSGNVGIGVTSPSAKLHLAAGTATASTAPLKLTSGTNLSTPENDAFEFDGTNLYFTVGGVRKTVTLV